ncbi:hypothetical protein PG326_00580 [Riemerella anatipestifer]|nr:hypothetical protein [Riemerella anatipestifer]MDY3356830.1 hypothetical protein [Riemerella anatipestifer]
MEVATMIQQLKLKFEGSALRAAIEMHTNYEKWQIEDLTSDELAEIYQRFFPRKTATQIAVEMENKNQLKELRSIVLKEASAIGLLEPDEWTSFNAFMLKSSPLKKPLNAYKLGEFEELIKQFKSMRAKYEKRAKVHGTKEWYHKNKLPMPSNN